MKKEETVDFHIRWAWTKMNKAYNAEASKLGATMSMGYTLLSIDKEGTPSTRLGPKMGMEPTSLTRLLNTLESEGYIKRIPSIEDGRKMLVHFTPKGRKYREITRQKVIQLNDRIQEIIPDKKLKVFFEVIQDINKLLDQNNIFNAK
jgi:DNA-binding MarR family transcriptional regulator